MVGCIAEVGTVSIGELSLTLGSLAVSVVCSFASKRALCLSSLPGSPVVSCAVPCGPKLAVPCAVSSVCSASLCTDLGVCDAVSGVFGADGDENGV
ncbi:unnamed protein product [Penicillium nalgiovense]|nr:unnamed protein product [Penicillium nalgiovense]CAG8077791.1 unnamed protein product [Penicillium nalgiovense]